MPIDRLSAMVNAGFIHASMDHPDIRNLLRVDWGAPCGAGDAPGADAYSTVFNKP